jgi:hypothetical protein
MLAGRRCVLAHVQPMLAEEAGAQSSMEDEEDQGGDVRRMRA